ncbi:MAG: hypothetical protein K2Z81_05520, partial [Cyanobacteria bacterium]|nr:hypothetical protein [Cyanobacteriota bacterium]
GGRLEHVKTDTFADAVKNSGRKREVIGKCLQGDALKDALAVLTQLDGVIARQEVKPTTALEIQDLMGRAASKGGVVLSPKGLEVLIALDESSSRHISDYDSALLVEAVNSGRFTPEMLVARIANVSAFRLELACMQPALDFVQRSQRILTFDLAQRLIDQGLDSNPSIQSILADSGISKAGKQAVLRRVTGESSGSREFDAILLPDLITGLVNSQNNLDQLKLSEAASVTGAILDGRLDRSPQVVQRLLNSDSSAVREISALIKTASITKEDMNSMLADVLSSGSAQRQYDVASGYRTMASKPDLLRIAMSIESGDVRRTVVANARTVEQANKIVSACGKSSENLALVNLIFQAAATPQLDRMKLFDRVVELELSPMEASVLSRGLSGSPSSLTLEQTQQILNSADYKTTISLLESGKVTDGATLASIVADRDGSSMLRALKDGMANETEIGKLLDMVRKNLRSEKSEWSEQIERVRQAMRAYASGDYKLGAGELARMIADPYEAFCSSLRLPDKYQDIPKLASTQRRALKHMEGLTGKVGADALEKMRKFVEHDIFDLHLDNPRELAARM